MARTEGRLLTMGVVAKHFGVQQHHVRRVFVRGLLPEPERVGAYRVIHEADLPAVEKALRQAGYLEGTEAATP